VYAHLCVCPLRPTNERTKTESANYNSIAPGRVCVVLQRRRRITASGAGAAGRARAEKWWVPAPTSQTEKLPAERREVLPLWVRCCAYVYNALPLYFVP